VRIAVPFIMQCPVRDHAPGCEVLPDIVSDAFYLLFAAHLDRECDLDFPGELCIRPLFRFLDFVPQGLPVAVFFRGAVRENDLTHNDSGFMSEIMNKSGLFIDQFLTGTIRCGSNGRPAAAPADDFNGAMIDRHSRSPPSSPRRVPRCITGLHEMLRCKVKLCSMQVKLAPMQGETLPLGERVRGSATAGSGAASRRTNGAERNGITWAPPMYKCALTA